MNITLQFMHQQNKINLQQVSQRETCGSCRGKKKNTSARCVKLRECAAAEPAFAPMGQKLFSLCAVLGRHAALVSVVCVCVFSFHYHNPAASPVRLDGDVCHVGCFFRRHKRALVLVGMWWCSFSEESEAPRGERGGGGGASRENKCCHLTSNSQCEPPLWCVVELCCHQRQHNTDV